MGTNQSAAQTSVFCCFVFEVSAPCVCVGGWVVKREEEGRDY